MMILGHVGGPRESFEGVRFQICQRSEISLLGSILVIGVGVRVRVRVRVTAS